MDPLKVALLTLAAVGVGIAIPVMLQLWLTLRKIQQELDATRAMIDPLLDDVTSLVAQIRSATHLTTALAAAVTAGVTAWQESRRATTADTP